MPATSRSEKRVCPYCRVAMEQGFVIDRQHHSKPGVQQWAEGTPEPSFWTGLKLKGKRVKKVSTWRCPDCGLLQSYAR